jgi:hypothetical protein
MAVPVWPASVPFEHDADNSNVTQSYQAPMSAETEAGISLMRPRPGPRITETGWRSVLWTEAEFKAFEQFVRINLRQGTLVFDMKVHKPGDGYVTRKCQLKNGIYTVDRATVPWTRVVFNLIIYNW